MTKHHVRTSAALLAGAAVALTTWAFMNPSSVKAQTAPSYDAARVAKGLEIAPVTLDFNGKDKNQVGYGSYLVNAIAGCNDCHTNPNYKPGNDPFLGKTKVVNAATHLGGGIVFGPFTSRNITPSAVGPTTGSLANFKLTVRTGVDLRKLHVPISPLLQVMPWPVHQDMTDSDIEAIFAYLTAIPCVEGGPEEKPNRCKPADPTVAVAEPKTTTTAAFQINLDGTKSKAANGGSLKYTWSGAKGSPTPTILFGDTANPIVQFNTRGPVDYKIDLTVTDASGTTSTDTVTVTYVGR
jgi:PKD domain